MTKEELNLYRWESFSVVELEIMEAALEDCEWTDAGERMADQIGEVLNSRD